MTPAETNVVLFFVAIHALAFGLVAVVRWGRRFMPATLWRGPEGQYGVLERGQAAPVGWVFVRETVVERERNQ